MPQSPFGITEIYSLGYWLKDYGYYPKSWPLHVYMDHGMTLFDKIPPHEIENDAPVIFKFSPRLVKIYKEISNKPVYNIVNPTIHCRRKLGVEKSPDAQGTLFFPAHSTEMIDDDTHWDTFITNLENIPDVFKPLDICLHPTDVRKGLDKIFKARGYSVLTAGSAYSPEFAGNLYAIMKNYKYTMSNLFGSYAFYSVEMGIPFSLFGAEPNYNNKNDHNIEKGSYVSYRQQPSYQKAQTLFSLMSTEITPEQKEFVDFELGKNTSISRMKASSLLYKSLVRHGILPGIKKGVRRLLSRIPGTARAKRFVRFQTAYYFKDGQERTLVKSGYVPKRELLDLKTYNRGSSSLLGNPISITGSFWHLHSLKEIFAEEVYRFRSFKPSPLIIDCGANIGLSVIYFKRLYPEARVIAFEPDATIFGMLRNNLHAFGYDDVEIHDKAIWTEKTILNFAASGSLGGKLEDGDPAGKPVIKVKTERLKDYLSEEVDFLKMDIEGPEVEVLKDCSDKLMNVQNLFVEYHSDPGKEQDLDCLLSILRRAGFRVYVKEAWNNLPHPFRRDLYDPFYDLQLNIFAYRISQPNERSA